ncbi:MAG: hypothetical protein ACI9WU_000142 [Myxococcota bacterium]|jgi:hypothetical protein
MLLSGCPGDPDTSGSACSVDPASTWQVVATCLEHELLSVWGTGPDDVWTVGAGGSVLRYSGCSWSRPDVGTDKDLWWVFGFKEGGPVFITGADGLILRDSGSGFEAMESGTTATLYGLWGAAPDDVYTVGFDPKGDGASALLHFDGTTWSQVADLPVDMASRPRFFKVWGRATNDVWVVGSDDMVLHWDGSAWSDAATGTGHDWVTVAGSGDLMVTVGGLSNAALSERQGTSAWSGQAPDFLQVLQGACVQPDGTALATGLGGTFVRRDASGWHEDEAAPFDVVNPAVDACKNPVPDYHSCFADGQGGYFVVGGNFLGGLTEGVLLHYGPTIPTTGL